MPRTIVVARRLPMMHINHRQKKYAGSKEFAYRKRDRNWAYGVKAAYKRQCSRRLRHDSRLRLNDGLYQQLDLTPKFVRMIQRLIDWY
jgi:hypothetical protein